MGVRITFRSEVVIDADSLTKAKELWENTELFPKMLKSFYTQTSLKSIQ